MDRYLRTQDKSIHVRNMIVTKATVEPKLHAEELRLGCRKANRLKGGKGYLAFIDLYKSQ
jgi:hypothetical protein